MAVPEGIIIGTKLKEAREAAGLTRKQLGELSGINFRSIEAYEQSIRDFNLARVDIVKAIAQALNKKIEDILDY